MLSTNSAVCLGRGVVHHPLAADHLASLDMLIVLLKRLADLLVSHSWLTSPGVASVSFLAHLVPPNMYGLITLSCNNWSITIIDIVGILLSILMGLFVLFHRVWVVWIGVEVEPCGLLLRVDLRRVLDRLQDMASWLAMLILVCIRCLCKHFVALCLKLLQKLTIVGLIGVVRLRSIAIDALCSTNVSPRILLLPRVEILDPYIFLLLLLVLLGTWINNIDRFVIGSFLLFLHFANVYLVYGNVWMVLEFRLGGRVLTCARRVVWLRQQVWLLLVIKVLPRSPQLVHVLIDIVFIAVVSSAAYEVVLLTAVLGSVSRRWIVEGLVVLLSVDFGKRHSIDVHLARCENGMLTTPLFSSQLIHVPLWMHYESSLVVSWVLYWLSLGGGVQRIDSLLLDILNSLDRVSTGWWDWLLFVLVVSHYDLLWFISLIGYSVMLLVEPCPLPLLLLPLGGRVDWPGQRNLPVLILRSIRLPLRIRFNLLLTKSKWEGISIYRTTYQSIPVSTEAIVNWCHFDVVIWGLSRTILGLKLWLLCSLSALHPLQIYNLFHLLIVVAVSVRLNWRHDLLGTTSEFIRIVTTI